MIVSLDTNAIIDFCYRSYPKSIFPSVWDQIHACISSGMLKFHECNSVHLEVEQQIANFQYDANIYVEFITDFRVLRMQPDIFANKTIEIKTRLLSLPALKKSSHVVRDNYADVDIVSLALHLKNDCLVLSSEQKNLNFNPKNPSNPNGLKVPNLCEIFSARSGTWSTLFEDIGMSI